MGQAHRQRQQQLLAEQSTLTPRTISYRTTVTTRTATTTRSLVGGQDACRNFLDVASAFKNYSEDTLLITVAYNLDDNAWCSGQNRNSSGGTPGTGTQTTTTGTSTGTVYLDDILNASGTSVANACRASGAGTSSSPYTFSATTCTQDVTLVYSRQDTVSRTMTLNNQRDQRVTDVLASAAGGRSIDASVANTSCASSGERAAENGDGDFYFCAASGDDLGPLFITALSQVGSGIRLLNLPRTS